MWYTVWKGSVRACLEHLTEKHGGSTFFALKNVAKLFPPWTVTRSVWLNALQPDVSGVAVDALLFHEAGRRLVHQNRIYRDPFPHPALRDGVISCLLSCVCRAMVIAQLTHLRISIPSSGAPPGQVPANCFPGGAPPPPCTATEPTPCVVRRRRHHAGGRGVASVLTGSGVAATDCAGGGGGNQRRAGGGGGKQWRKAAMRRWRS